jgi:hypothetical protein
MVLGQDNVTGGSTVTTTDIGGMDSTTDGIPLKLIAVVIGLVAVLTMGMGEM